MEAIMEIEDHPDFPRFNVASTALRDAEGGKVLFASLTDSHRCDILHSV
jgi:hypothetical protein